MVRPTVGSLSAEPSRQAVASLAGYVFQIWHSLLEWLRLGDVEALELEGNEDIDRLCPGEATTTQVKNIDPTRSLTLRSPDVVDAVNNYWSAKGRNSGVQLRFRFLSTAEAGMEAGGPFGSSKGLDVWRATRRRAHPEADLLHAAQIKAFLLSLEGISVPLKGWLSAVTPDQVLSGLIGQVEWDLGTGGMPEVRRVVEEQLVLLGQPYGVLPANARRAVPGLLDQVLQKATSKSGRFLRRIDLLDAFEAITSVMVPIGSYGAATARAALLPMAAGFASITSPHLDGSSYLVVQAAIRDGMPDLPTTILPRPELQTRISASLANGFAHLHGSTGMGKSTMAVLVARRLEEPPLWLDLRAATQHAPALIRAAVTGMAQERAHRSLVLDDAAFEGDSRPLQDAIAYAASAIPVLGGGLLVTSPTELPSPLRLRLRLSGACQHHMPGLDEGEVDQLLAEHGLVNEQARRSWATVVLLQTNGHPQLVDARIQTLRDRGFPRLVADDLLSGVPADVAGVRSEARKLIGDLPERKRDLLYRLSLSSMSFKRDAALRIGRLPPPVVPAGDAFDHLVGPWIERVAGKRYRVSPLVQDAGKLAFGDDWAAETHARIADILLHGQLDQFDLQNICVHAVLGRNPTALLRLNLAVVRHAERLGPADGTLDLLSYIDPNEGGASLAPTPDMRAVLRIAQFAIAARHVDGERALRAAEILDVETRIKPGHTTRERVLRFLALSMMLRHTDVALTPAFVVRSTAELSELQSETEDLHDAVGEISDGTLAGLKGQADVGWLLLAFLHKRLRTASDLDALWRALDELGSVRRGVLLSPLSADPAKAQYLPDAVWLAEMRSDRPEWARLASTLRNGYGRALAWNAPGFAAVIAATAIRTLNTNYRVSKGRLEGLKSRAREAEPIYSPARGVIRLAAAEDRVGEPRHLILYRVAPGGVTEMLGIMHDRQLLSRAARQGLKAAQDGRS